MKKEIVLSRQKRDFTCGIAAMAVVAQLLKVNFPRGTILEAIGAKPVIGTCNKTFAEWACLNMQVKSYGSGTYDGGLAISNIQNKDSGIGHYVVMLGIKEGIYRYYCPLLGEIFSFKKEEIIWKNSTGEVLDWSINFETSDSFYDLKCTPERHVFFLGDMLETLNHKLDNSLKLKAAYEARDQSVSWHTQKDIFIKNRQLFLDGVPVLKNDIVWFRCNPVNTIHYYELLRKLCHVKAKIINSPQSILLCHDKLSVSSLPTGTDYYTVSSEEGLKKAYNCLLLNGHEKIIIKVPSRFGGNNIFLAHDFEKLRDSYINMVEDSGYVIVQGYIDMEGGQVDTRVLVTTTNIIGVFDRIAPKGSYVCNIHQEGVAGKNKGLSQEQIKKVKEAQKFMQNKGVFFAGLDFLADNIIEMNISCPGGIYGTNIINDTYAEYDLIDACHKYLA